MKRAADFENGIKVECKMEKKVDANFQLEQRKDFNAKKMHSSSLKGPGIFKLDSLPSNVVHLGGENFLSVVRFLGHTRVHIRKHVCHGDGYYQPTKEGISISPAVWDSLCKHLHEFNVFSDTERLIIMDKDLCVSKEKNDNEPAILFQRLYQRKNLSFQFVPECVTLNPAEFRVLCVSVDKINAKIKKSLIKYTLRYFFEVELSATKEQDIFMCDSIGIDELKESLGRCIASALSSEIPKLMDCLGCQRELENSLIMHNCIMNRVEKFEAYFERALYLLDWGKAAKDFITRNINVDLNTMFCEYGFFDLIEVDEIFNIVEGFYVVDEFSEGDYKNLVLSVE